MNAALRPPPELTSSGIRPADRLGFTLFVATLLHLALILGVSFTLAKPGELSKTLEITLSTFNSDKQPDKADYLAQHNQQGSGTLEHKAAPKTTEQAPFQDSKVNKVTPAAAPQPTQRKEAVASKTSLTTTKQQQQKAATKQKEEEPQPDAQHAPIFDSTQLSAEIASLEAELAQEQQLYAKRPKIHRLNAASTMRDKGAWYKDEWRRKIERVGNLNYPNEAKRQKIYGQLILMVSINRDGTINEMLLVESSGHKVLDEAAMKIVRLSAPFAPFEGDMAEFDRLEITRTWRFDRSDRLFSQ
ncbi:energy transducer TonB [Pseudomonas sp. F(2018)]|uniref:energy transducer TonB n=1 Tax=Pseudomonas sp. F(2018) TaxID=2502240 RepID=UPI0010F5A7FE|nr:energy transducer TonB [Pseudomonas sp. F(2018)]